MKNRRLRFMYFDVKFTEALKSMMMKNKCNIRTWSVFLYDEHI